MLDNYLPTRVNEGPWAAAYTLMHLREQENAEFVLPVCSLATPLEECASLGEYVLPPLYHEAMHDDLKESILSRITICFPRYQSESNRLRVVELPRIELPKPESPPNLLSFSVDTAVEEHGPHLPLCTDTIQSYAVIKQLAVEFDEVAVERPVEYGQLTWGLPFGHSIDLTTDLLTQYVTGYVNALVQWKSPAAIYVVDVHGSATHRDAIVQGLKNSDFDNWSFRWLYDPLAEYSSERGDQHAGGVETALVERVSAGLVDPQWWPHRMNELAEQQMSFKKAVELTPDLDAFCRYVQERSANGIIGDIHNYNQVDADELFEHMMSLSRQDVRALISGKVTQSSGGHLW